MSLHVNLRRYVTGADVFAPNLDSAPEWWWSIPFSPMTVWFLGTLAFTGMLVAIAYPAWRRPAAEPLPAAAIV